jgi:hypothetical protein
MHQGRRPLIRRSGRVWAQAAAIVCVAVLGLGAVAAAAPKGDQGPPDQAQGNGPPAAPPPPWAPGQAKEAPATGVTTQPGAGAHGQPAGGHSSTGGPAKARARGRTGTTQSSGGGLTSGFAHSNGAKSTQEQDSSHGGAGKVTLCHATGAGKNPRQCSAGASQAGEHENGNAPSGTLSPEAGPLGRNVRSGETPSGEDGTLGISDEGDAAPGADGGVLGADQGGGDESGATAEATSASLPFTGLGLGLLVAMGAMLALAGVYVRRRTA